ncbi:Hypothetical predicted protein [Octopus vulgaris]|uniref:Uncharacterized protein n=1 Tax=Octopus vulgaris TaxID=6645 RepID=A0AA36FRD7_OCTVU|nr:Hypothetical predicted protein [Octopus vulgaris]
MKYYHQDAFSLQICYRMQVPETKHEDCEAGAVSKVDGNELGDYDKLKGFKLTEVYFDDGKVDVDDDETM